MVKATLIKLKTDDGLLQMRPHIQLGKVYEVDPTTRKAEKGVNTDKCVLWEREIILTENGEWLPTEMLDIKE